MRIFNAKSGKTNGKPLNCNKNAQRIKFAYQACPNVVNPWILEEICEITLKSIAPKGFSFFSISAIIKE